MESVLNNFSGLKFPEIFQLGLKFTGTQVGFDLVEGITIHLTGIGIAEIALNDRTQVGPKLEFFHFLGANIEAQFFAFRFEQLVFHHVVPDIVALTIDITG